MREDSGRTSAYSMGLLIILIASLWLGCGSDDEQENGDHPDKIVGDANAEMVLIPAGEFEMGDLFNEGTTYERPSHTVFIDDFYIDVYEVTNAMYAKFLNAMGKHVGDTDHIWLDIGDGDEQIELVGGNTEQRQGLKSMLWLK